MKKNTDKNALRSKIWAIAADKYRAAYRKVSLWDVKRFSVRTYSILALSITVVGIVLFRLLRPTPDIAENRALMEITTVESDIVAMHPIIPQIETVGILKATDSAVLKAEVAGTIGKILFQDGTPVKNGMALIEIDSDVQKASYQSAVTEYNLAKAEYNRVAELAKRNIMPLLEKDRSYAKMASAESRVRLEKARLDQYTIKAPFDGIVGLRDISAGSFVQGAQEVITIINLNPIKVDFKVPELHAPKLKIGQSAKVVVAGFDADFQAKIDAIDPKVESTGHSVHVRASIENVHAQLRPGMFAHVFLSLGEEADAIMIPEGAIARTGDDDYVYVIRTIGANKVAVRTVVTTGLRENGMVEIVEGLSPGYEIVTAGHVKIHDGKQVRVVQSRVNNPQPQEEGTTGVPSESLEKAPSPETLSDNK